MSAQNNHTPAYGYSHGLDVIQRRRMSKADKRRILDLQLRAHRLEMLRLIRAGMDEGIFGYSETTKWQEMARKLEAEHE